jgi:rRNA maturation RNase YbeY
MSTAIALANQQDRARISAPRLRRLAAWLMTQAVQRDPSLAGTALSMALVDDAGIAPINEQFVRHARAHRRDQLPLPHPCPARLAAPLELIINVERAVHEAARRRHIPPTREFGLYVAHGCLHLTGEDDATPAQRARMQRIQTPLAPTGGRSRLAGRHMQREVRTGLTASEVFAGKSAFGMTFEVALKSCHLFPGGESDDYAEAPGSEFCRVGYVSGIMAAQTLLRIIGASRIMMGGVRNRFEYVSIMHGLPGRSSEGRDGWPGFVPRAARNEAWCPEAGSNCRPTV